MVERQREPEDILEANRLLIDDIDRRIEGTIDDGARVEGRGSLGVGTIVKAGSIIRGPAGIGRDCVIGPDTYVGPYTSMGDRSRIGRADIESSIMIGECEREGTDKIINSLIGRTARFARRVTD